MTTLRPLYATILIALLSLPVCRGDDDEEDSPVDLRMEQVSRDLKKLSRQVENENSRDSSLGLVDSMIKANAEAVDLIPESVGDREGNERKKYLALYRHGMEELGECLAELKAAIEKNDTARAAELVEKAYDLREEYHKKLL